MRVDSVGAKSWGCGGQFLFLRDESARMGGIFQRRWLKLEVGIQLAFRAMNGLGGCFMSQLGFRMMAGLGWVFYESIEFWDDDWVGVGPLSQLGF